MGIQAIKFVMQSQQGDNWCWAANASSISLLYDPNSSWMQCKIVSAFYNNAPACPPVQGGPWDKQGRLDTALGLTGNLAGSPDEGPLKFERIGEEINACRVVGVQITWPDGGGAHFVCIYGYDDTSGSKFVYVADPKYPMPGGNLILLDRLIRDYHQPGSTWTLSYLTKHNSPSAVPLQTRFASPHTNLVSQISGTDVQHEMLRNQRFPTRLPIHRSKLRSHGIGYIPLTSILSGSPQMVNIGLRVLRERKKQFYLSDFEHLQNAESQENDPLKLVAIVLDQEYVSLYIRLWREILVRQRTRKTRYRLLFIRQPELGVEAFCIQYGRDFEVNEYVLINNIIPASPLVPYLGQAEFFAMLEKRAKGRDSITDKYHGGH